MMHRIQRALLAAIAALVLASAASAGDLSANWTGCYIGANAGFGGAKVSWTDAGAPEGSNTATGGLVGGQIGCDYQLASDWVVGLQGLYDWASNDGGHPYTDDTRYTDHTKISSLGTLTGRLGYLVEPATQIYLKAGAAWVDDSFTETCLTSVDVCPGVGTAIRTGWTIGGGVEHQFTPNWSIFLEYNYMDFGSHTETLTYTDASTFDYGVEQTVHAVQVGISYRF